MLHEELEQVVSQHDESCTLCPFATLDGQAELLLQILNLLQDTCHRELQTLVPGILPLLHLQTQNTVHFHLLNTVHFHLLFIFTCKHGSLSPKHSSLLPAKHGSLSPALLNMVHFHKKQNELISAQKMSCKQQGRPEFEK